MRKCAKSELAKKLEACCEEVLELPLNIQTTRNTAYIFDSMATLQAPNDSCFKTFNDLAEIIVKRLVRKLWNSDVDVVAIVFDRYLAYLSRLLKDNAELPIQNQHPLTRLWGIAQCLITDSSWRGVATKLLFLTSSRGMYWKMRVSIYPLTAASSLLGDYNKVRW